MSQQADDSNELHNFAAKTVKARPDSFNQVLQMAFGKSLANYGYLDRSDTSNPLAVEFEISQASFEELEDGLLASVMLDVSSEHPCLNAQANSKFLALSIKDQQKGRRAFAVILGTVASIGSGLYFMDQQLDTAQTLNKLETYGKDLAVGEGYAPKRGDKTAKRYALKNAIRLSIARYVTLIDEQCKQ